MLASPFPREVHFRNIMVASTMPSRVVPRCLFGPPNPKETMELFQETLDMERSRFAKRWGVNPISEDKENLKRNSEPRSPTTRKNRTSPYSKQTSIHDFWRSRKNCEVKKALVTSSVDPTTNKQDISK